MLCVFLPLTLISGMTGVLFKQLGWIVSIIMIVSTTAALTLVPMLCSQFLSNSKSDGKLYHKFFDPINRFLDKISNGYAKIIKWGVTHRKTVVFSTFGILALVVIFMAPMLKTEYFPKQDSDRITVSINLPQGTAQSATAEVANNFYNELRADIPEITVCNMIYGQADSDNILASMQSNGTNIISISMHIGDKTTRKRSSSEIADQVRALLKKYPEIRKGTVSEGGGGSGWRIQR